MIIPQAYAVNEIINKALPADIASKTPAEGLAFYIAILWRSVVTLGGVAFIIFLIWGGIEWLTAGGDKGRLETAHKMITNALIGLAVLVGSYAIALFIQNAFKINILAPVFPNNL
jgi:TRAP-type C4-dicarboxylate transport system permease small subunit